MIETITAYKNSDGFVTDDIKLAKKREKILIKIDKLNENKWLEYQLLTAELEFLTWPDWMKHSSRTGRYIKQKETK